MNDGSSIAGKRHRPAVRYACRPCAGSVEPAEGGVTLRPAPADRRAHFPKARSTRPARSVSSSSTATASVLRREAVGFPAPRPARAGRGVSGAASRHRKPDRLRRRHPPDRPGQPLESPLGAIARLKDKSGEAFLPAEALAAGERLHADFTRAQLQPRLTMAYEPRLSSKTKGRAGGTADLCDTALAARMRVGRAMEAIGPELCGVALDVCCFQKGLEIVERERQWPVRSAKLMLRTALMALARHYAPPRSGKPAKPCLGSGGLPAGWQRPGAGIRPPAAGQPRP